VILPWCCITFIPLFRLCGCGCVYVCVCVCT